MKKLLTIIFILQFLVGHTQCLEGDCENGKGTYTSANGNKYVGEYKDGEKNGQGITTWVSGEFAGDKYVGEYKKDYQHGNGTYTYANGDI